jgi:hypothetical protein
LLLGTVLVGRLHAQTGQGAITGTVTDPQAAAVQDAVVEVVNSDSGVRLSTKTNQAGLFSVFSLNPGTYELAVTKPGFERTITSSIIVNAAQTATVNVSLSIGKETSSVTVTAQGALLSTDVPDVSTTVDHVIVEHLPYPERSSLEATLLVPGVNGDPLQPGGVTTENPNAYQTYVTPGASISVGGAAPGQTSLIVDGSDVTQGSFPRAGVNLSGDVVQEVTAITGGISAKYGRTGGGVIVQTSRPGTDQYHGAVSWRHTDPFFNAYPMGSSARSALHQNYYGFYFGGPVWIPKLYNGHKKTFFFVGVEPARMSNQYVFRGSFFTPDELAGNLNNSLAVIDTNVLKHSGYAAAIAAPRPKGNGVYYQAPINANGFPNGPTYSSTGSYQQVMGPLADCGSAWITANPSATACPNDVGPQLKQNAFAQFVLSQMPTPGNPGPYVKFYRSDASWDPDGTNAYYNRGVINRDNRYSIRVDHQVSNSDQIWGRYTDIPVEANRYFALPTSNPLQMVPSDESYAKDIALGWTHVFNSQLVNSLHTAFLRNRQLRLAPAATQDYAAKYGLTSSVSGKGFPGLGNLTPSGYTGIQPGISNASIQIDQNFVVGDDLTWTKGTHLLQFGVDIRRIQSNQYDMSGLTGGKYTFNANAVNSGAGNGSALGTFILGNISAYANTPVSVPGYYRWHYYAGYFQDDWRIFHDLTLNLGLRYEVEEPRAEAHDNQGAVYTGISGTLNGMATTSAFCFANGCNHQKNLWPINWKGFEPRIGISYAPTPRTTVRAAYALSRAPLTGYENTPDPNFNVPSTSIGGQNGGLTPNSTVNYITNPIGPLSSGYTSLNGNRGPINYSTGLTLYSVNQSNRVPYIQQWSLTTQYQVASRTLIQLTYQGMKGTHLIGPFTTPLNSPDLGKLVSLIQSHANFAAQIPNSYGITQNGAVINETLINTLYPYQNFFNQTLLELYPRNGSSSYNGFYASVNQQYGAGLSLLANYSWSKSLDNVGSTNTTVLGGFSASQAQNPFDLNPEWSVSGFDQSSRLKAGYAYQLPFGRGKSLFGGINRWADLLVGGWSTSGIFTMQSGVPNTITLGNQGYFYSTTPYGQSGCTNKANCISAALPTGYVLRPNIVPGVPLINKNWKKAPFTNTPYLNSAAFSIPGSVDNPQFGNAPRTLAGARSPRETMFDANVSKSFGLGERRDLSITANLLNAFNHPVYYGVNTRTLFNNSVATFTNPASFGLLNNGNSAGMSRIIQLGARLDF